jgi:enoyl-[acyl-carrier protein] reductase/trans-2-enoyl-CoA reductase (NAD+)
MLLSWGKKTENVDGCVKGRKSTSSGATTVAYSYASWVHLTELFIEKTIGRAKDDLEATAFTITDSLADINGKTMFL